MPDLGYKANTLNTRPRRPQKVTKKKKHLLGQKILPVFQKLEFTVYRH